MRRSASAGWVATSPKRRNQATSRIDGKCRRMCERSVPAVAAAVLSAWFRAVAGPSGAGVGYAASQADRFSLDRRDRDDLHGDQFVRPSRRISANPPPGVNAGPDGKPAPFREPVRLSSKDGVLEVRLSAHQGTVNLDTVTEPVSNFLVFGYELIKGTSSDGSTKGDDLYPAPTLRVEPGERADRPLRQRSSGPDDQGLLRPGVHPQAAARCRSIRRR